MARKVYFVNCLAGIRQATFGRDNRKPIADAIEMTHTNYMPEAQEVQKEDNYRIATMTLTPLAEDDYFRLVFTRSNGT